MNVYILCWRRIAIFFNQRICNACSHAKTCPKSLFCARRAWRRIAIFFNQRICNACSHANTCPKSLFCARRAWRRIAISFNQRICSACSHANTCPKSLFCARRAMVHSESCVLHSHLTCMNLAHEHGNTNTLVSTLEEMNSENCSTP